MKAVTATILLCALLVVAGCGEDSEEPVFQSGAEAAERDKPEVDFPDEPAPSVLVKRDLIAGTGAVPKDDDVVTINYVGWAYDRHREADASWNYDKTYAFKVGAGLVLKGWDLGVRGMRVGGRREVIIPPELAYGEGGALPGVAPNEAMIFIFDLLKVD